MAQTWVVKDVLGLLFVVVVSKKYFSFPVYPIQLFMYYKQYAESCIIQCVF